MNQKDAELVFVYGTLRVDEGNHWLLENSRLVSEQCWTNGILVDTGFGYPAIVREMDTNVPTTNHRVFGELYQVTFDVLEKLDQLEDYHGPGHTDNMYDRVDQTVYSSDQSYEAYVYVWEGKRGSKFSIISSGDWKSRCLK